MDTTKRILDYNELKFNQFSIITLSLIGYMLDSVVFPAIVACILLAGSLKTQFAIFKVFYRYIIKPLGILKPNLIEDISAPHQFAQILGGVFLGIGSILLILKSSILGWMFIWIVIILAAVNLFFGFCTGCFVYYQLAKRGIPLSN